VTKKRWSAGAGGGGATTGGAGATEREIDQICGKADNRRDAIAEETRAAQRNDGRSPQDGDSALLDMLTAAAAKSPAIENTIPDAAVDIRHRSRGLARRRSTSCRDGSPRQKVVARVSVQGVCS